MATQEAIWPVSVAGWVGLILSFAAVGGLFLTWGKWLAKLDAIRSALTKLTQNVEQLDPHLSAKVDRIDERLDELQIGITKMEHTLWGPDGKNGALSVLRDSRARIDAIEARNRVIDALEERARGADRVGSESRQHSRRKEDRLLRGEEPTGDGE